MSASSWTRMMPWGRPDCEGMVEIRAGGISDIPRKWKSPNPVHDLAALSITSTTLSGMLRNGL